MEPPYYRDSFSKHLHSLARSNYFASRLDADDLRFLEYVKKTGLANGGVPSTNVVLLEELEFWRGPYTIQPNVDRHFGRRPIPQETPEHRAARQARSNRWHAQRIIRENERAMAAAELAREQREHEAAQAKRKAREMMTDAEWNAAAPEHAPFGGLKGRHYVPQWKLDDSVVVPAKQRARNKLIEDAKAALRESAKKQAEKARIRAEQIKQELEAERVREAAAALARDKALKETKERQLGEELRRRRTEKQRTKQEQAEQESRQRVIDEARANVRRLDRIIGVQGVPVSYTRSTLRGAIMTLLNSTPGHVWTREEMARSLGVTDMDFLESCLNELVVNGHLKKMDKP